MSRIGKMPITIPSGVEVKLDEQSVSVKGKNGSMTRPLNNLVDVKIEDGSVVVTPRSKGRRTKAAWGMMRSQLQNMVEGVTEGFKKELEIIGVGYRAAVSGKKLTLNLGFSHPVEVAIPNGITVKVEKNTQLIVTSMEKDRLGQFCANIRDYRPPEPYKGKGIRYAGEYVMRKEGKKK
ncbi:MAG: 50S ribosomal protein L6 [Magnetococcales bacterium]|nr:50S ribosomal protein L6 [Magnetococcales bacterium]